MFFANHPIGTTILFIIIAFISGSIPFGLIYGLIRGIDIRQSGSGNIGATNVGRIFGFWQGFVPVFLLDFLKGAVPLLIFKILIHENNDICNLLVGFSAILGHVFSPWLKFKGGKGVATSAGVLFVLAPIPSLIILAVFIASFFLFGKITGKASVTAALAMPFVMYLTPGVSIPLRLASVLLAALIIYAHKKNIKEWFSIQ